LRVSQIRSEAFTKAEQLHRCAFNLNLIFMLFVLVFVFVFAFVL